LETEIQDELIASVRMEMTNAEQPLTLHKRETLVDTLPVSSMRDETHDSKELASVKDVGLT
jgi:hypothetical protein